MNDPYLTNASVYLLDTVFGLYLLLIMLRFLLQLARANFYNPLSQFLVKVTNPLLIPLRRVVPGLFGIDMASVLLLFIVQVVALVLTHLAAGITTHFPGVLVMAVGELISLALNCYLISIIAQIILSWVGPGGNHPIADVLYSLNEPVLRPARRMLPVMGGMDFSPMIVVILIQLTKILVVAPITDLGRVLG